MAAYRRVYDSRHVTCRLTAKNPDKLRNPTLGNRVWATFLVTMASICTVCELEARDRQTDGRALLNAPLWVKL